MVQNASLAKRNPVSDSRVSSPFDFHERRRSEPTGDAKDYFVCENGQRFAGMHVLVDFWEASHLDDTVAIEAALREAADACGATLLHVHLHAFSTNGGVSGVAVLAESHISIHTWPELEFAAFDVFMCGSCDPRHAVPVLRRAFKPGRERVDERKRGLVE